MGVLELNISDVDKQKATGLSVEALAAAPFGVYQPAQLWQHCVTLHHKDS